MASVQGVRVGVALDVESCTDAKPVDLKICSATAACVTHRSVGRHASHASMYLFPKQTPFENHHQLCSRAVP